VAPPWGKGEAMKRWFFGAAVATVLGLSVGPALGGQPYFYRGKITIRDRSGEPFIASIDGSSMSGLIEVPGGGRVQIKGLLYGDYDLLLDYNYDTVWDDGDSFYLGRSYTLTIYP